MYSMKYVPQDCFLVGHDSFVYECVSEVVPGCHPDLSVQHDLQPAQLTPDG